MRQFGGEMVDYRSVMTPITPAPSSRAGAGAWSRKLRAFGVTSAKRQESFPELPAIGEVVPGFESEAWFGVFGPAKLPDDITNKLNAAIVAALNDPKMREQLQREGATPAARSPSRGLPTSCSSTTHRSSGSASPSLGLGCSNRCSGGWRRGAHSSSCLPRRAP